MVVTLIISQPIDTSKETATAPASPPPPPGSHVKKSPSCLQRVCAHISIILKSSSSPNSQLFQFGDLKECMRCKHLPEGFEINTRQRGHTCWCCLLQCSFARLHGLRSRSFNRIARSAPPPLHLCLIACLSPDASVVWQVGGSLHPLPSSSVGQGACCRTGSQVDWWVLDSDPAPFPTNGLVTPS